MKHNGEFILKPIHPFPARMAPSIVWNELPSARRSLRILDPMAGSGTTLATARFRGHEAIGFDTDPLAILIAKAWCANLKSGWITKKADIILDHAIRLSKKKSFKMGYPSSADDETRKFIRFWFDLKNRKQLAALSDVIGNLKNESLKVVMWCAFSRMIITKKIGVSLGMDISHSRPHKVYERAPIAPFDQFLKTVSAMIKSMPFKDNEGTLPSVKIIRGDARKLPLSEASVDMVVTSPPYFNAIDYMRGHKLALVWMGHSISKLRKIRSSNIGAENIRNENNNDWMRQALLEMGSVDDFSPRLKGMLRKYLFDMNAALREMKRVVVKKGKIVMVIGDCTIKGEFVSNSNAIRFLALRNNLSILSLTKRPLPENRRYLPPPSSKRAGIQLQGRMREEVILSLQT